jgi:LysW-gamma-L-alpha-aminoadipyl-6-phosphate/LysW-L-glutamyl-5-phosphate reductase
MIKTTIIGASGYTGGELIRLLKSHPKVELSQVTSERHAGKFIWKLHPNLRKQTDLKFSRISEIEECDVIFCCLPHGEASMNMQTLIKKAKKIVDLSADFRLKSKEDYKKWYHLDHPCPELLEKFVYGIPEVHRDEMKKSSYVSGAGCNATATILALYPFVKEALVEKAVVEVKVGSSEAGKKSSSSSHHPERSSCVRSFMPVKHRHIAEILQELNNLEVYFSATSIDIVRGVLATCHLFLNKYLDEKQVWALLRKAYSDEKFIRIVKDKEGNYRFPEPKILSGTNFCDIGFALEENRLVVISAIDNLMKGAAGQAVQAFNIMHDIEENTGLEFTGLHPI